MVPLGPLAKASELMTQAPTFHFETSAQLKVWPWSLDSSRYMSRCTTSWAERNSGNSSSTINSVRRPNEVSLRLECCTGVVEPGE